MIAIPLMQAAADRIKALRAARALTQEDLAALAERSVASVQRVERGEKAGADTSASIAAAFDIPAETLTAALGDDRPYLPLAVIDGGRALVGLVTGCSRLDFGFDELDTLDQAEVLETIHDFCASLNSDDAPETPHAVTRGELEAHAMLAQLSEHGFVVSDTTLAITAHDVENDGGTGIAIPLAQWDETIAVLRVGVGPTLDRAYVLDSLGRWEVPRGDAPFHPAGSRENGDCGGDWGGIGSDTPSGGSGCNV